MIYDLANDISQDVLCSIVDGNGRALFVSKSHFDLLGYHPSALLSSNLNSFVHPDDLPLVQNKFLLMYKHKDSFDITFRFRHQNGQWITLCSRCKPFLKDDGTFLYTLITCFIKEDLLQMTS